MDAHTLKVLEFDKIKQKLSGLCQSPLGQQRTAAISPISNPQVIQQKLNQAQQMKEILLYEGGFPSLAVDDLREVLHQVKPEGTSLDSSELLKLANLLLCLKEIAKFAKNVKGKYVN
jgi:DNA mismatch repair protein MutS2